MEKTFNIFSEIVNGEAGKWTNEDICLSDFTNFAKDLNEGDEVVIDINSPGGSVTEGIAIANQIRELSKKGIHTTAKVEGICASIATVIMCACDNIVLNDTAFLMIHTCWSVVQGDADTLRKEADIMEKMNEAILSFYRSKFDLTDQELKDYMDAETWFSGAEAENFKLKCEVVKSEQEFKIAACVKKFDFKNTPQRIRDMENIDVSAKAEEVEKVETLDETSPSEDTPDEDTPDEEENEPDMDDMKAELEKAKERISELEKSNEDLTKENEDLKKQLAECGGDEQKKDSANAETITKAECEKRVSGMQSKMQTQINDFQNQLMAKNEELTKAKAEITSLKNSLEHTSEELKSAKTNLEQTASALEEKNKALERLNSGVNAHAEELPTMEEGLRNCSSPEAKVAFLKSGKYVR